MTLLGQSRVGSKSWPRKRNLLQTCWMNFLPFLSSGEDVKASFFGTIYNGFGRERGVLGCGLTCVLEEFESFGDAASH